MKVSAEVHNRVVEKLAKCIEIVNERYGKNFAMPDIEYDVRGTKAGWVYSHINVVHYNPTLLMENVEEFIARTVPHELAHILTYNIHGYEYRGRKRQIHGPSWRQMMTLLGAPVSRCHSYDVSKARTKRKITYKYICTHCKETVSLGPKRHAKQQRRGNVYTHAGCHGAPLVLASQYNRVQKAADLPTKKSGNPSKKDRAQEIFNRNRHLGRATIIKMFMADLSMSKSGASTYYYNCSKSNC